MKRKLMTLAAGSAAALATLVGASAAQAASPTIVLQSPTAITTSSAEIRATVTPGGAPTYVRVEWGLTAVYDHTTAYVRLSHDTTAQAVKIAIAGLQPGTIYHYKLDALNKFGGASTTDHAFKTAGHAPPDVATGGADILSDNAATVTAIINPHGQATQYYFEYGPQGAPTTNDVKTPVKTLASKTEPTVVSANLLGLAPGTYFHFRAVAVHAGTGGDVTVAGAYGTFLTFPDPAHKQAPGIFATTTPRHPRHRPYVFTTSGHLTPPAGIPGSLGCPQNGTVTFVYGRHRLAYELLAVGADCTFRITTSLGPLPKVHGRKHHKRKPIRIRIYVRFPGNGYVLPVSAPIDRVQVGK